MDEYDQRELEKQVRSQVIEELKDKCYCHRFEKDVGEAIKVCEQDECVGERCHNFDPAF